MTNTDVDTSVTGQNALIERTGEVQARAFALKGGAALNAMLAGIADQKAAERLGAIRAMLFLEETYSDEEQHSIPVVGSKKGETGNKPYDRFSKKIRTKDGEKSVPASWFTEVVHSIEEYERIANTIRWLDGGAELNEKVPDDIKAIVGTAAGHAMKAELRDRVSDMRTGLTKGSMLFHHVEMVASVNPARIQVKMPYAVRYVIKDGERVKIPGTNEYLTEQYVTGSKIRVQDPAKIFEDKIYSVSSFLQLKPDNEIFAKLPAEDQTIVALDDTSKRPPKTPDKEKANAANNAKTPTNLEGGLTLFNALSTWVDQETDEGEKVYNQLLTKMASKDADADETVMSVGKLCLTLDALWTIIRPRYNLLNEQMTKNKLIAKGATGTTG